MSRARGVAAVLSIVFVLIPGCGRGASGAHSIDHAHAFGGERGRAGALHQPRAIEALPADGGCVVIDRSGRVQRYSSDGALSHAWLLPAWSEGQPIALALAPWGNLVVSDTHYQRILEYTPAGELVRTFGESAGLQLVRGIDVGADGTIYVADYGELDRVHRFDREGRHLGTFGARGDGPGGFLRPEGIAIGAAGDVYVVDCGHHRISVFGPEGDYRFSFGREGTGPGEFAFPFDIARGSDDTFYVVDFQGNRVQRFGARGEFLGAAGGAGRAPGEFSAPRGVAVLPDAAGDLVFVADTANHRVQRFQWKYGQ